ncbi:MAG: hypothetical protein JNM22_18510 [Saprospiraceae bacterium]|nr:hypothetical protein [Saprospiraceae bacterium]
MLLQVMSTDPATLKEYFGQLLQLFVKGVTIISFLPLVVGIIKRSYFNKALKVYWLFLLVSLLLYALEPAFIWMVKRDLDFWIPVLKACSISDTNFLRYTFHINNFTLLGWFLYLILKPRSVTMALTTRWLSIALLIAVTINYFFIQGYNVAGGFNSTVSALYCFTLPLLSMWFIFNHESRVPLGHNPYFWINLGLIIPNILGIFLYFAGDILSREDYVLYARLNIAKYLIEMLAQILTAIGFYYAKNVKYLQQ